MAEQVYDKIVLLVARSIRAFHARRSHAKEGFQTANQDRQDQEDEVVDKATALALCALLVIRVVLFHIRRRT